MNPPRRVLIGLLSLWASFGFSRFSRADDRWIGAGVHLTGAAADCLSTRAALNRVGTTEVGPVASRTGPTSACLIRGAAWVTADVIIAKKAPKLKWPLRVVSVAASAYLVHHNSKQGR